MPHNLEGNMMGQEAIYVLLFENSSLQRCKDKVIIMKTNTSEILDLQCCGCGEHFDSYEKWKAHQRAEHEPTLVFRLLDRHSTVSVVKEDR